MLLIRESRGLLLGEVMSRHATDDIQRITQSCDGVSAVNCPLTLHFGPEFILPELGLRFAPGLSRSADVSRPFRLRLREFDCAT